MKSQAGYRKPAATEQARSRRQIRRVRAGLAGVLLLYVIMSCIGITWGLPSRKIDKFLFGDGEVWSGEKIYWLARAGEKFSAERTKSTGADVDVDPLNARGESLPSPQPSPLEGEGDTARQEPRPPLLLTGTEEDVAKIYLRYRLYTYQPDEMITMMALAGMRPGELQFDPRLYQYGGLFIYPVGALIKICGMLGLIDVRSDLVFYLDKPDEFGKFYVVARAYSAAWGLVGVIIIFALTRRVALAIETSKPSSPQLNNLGFDDQRTALATQIRNSKFEVPRRIGNEDFAGLIATFLFALMPVVVCMSHEGKPHLPGAVLMLLAVYFALRAVDGICDRKTGMDISNLKSEISNFKSQISDPKSPNLNSIFYWLMCATCGAGVGMVLSSWPICVLIPLTVLIQYRRSKIEDREPAIAAITSVVGLFLAVAVYFATNPYVMINFFFNPEILRSNFGNSLAMYEVTRVAEGLIRVLQLMGEGISWPIAALGLSAIIGGIHQFARWPHLWLILVPATMFFLQFVLIGAGKPAEYGRFGIFPDAVLAMGAAILLVETVRSRVRGLGWFFVVAGFVGLLYFGGAYLRDFHTDTTGRSSRLVLAREIQGMSDKSGVALRAEPAPYSCPPLPFASMEVWLLPKKEQMPDKAKSLLFIHPIDELISWANKKFWASRD